MMSKAAADGPVLAGARRNCIPVLSRYLRDYVCTVLKHSTASDHRGLGSWARTAFCIFRAESLISTAHAKCVFDFPDIRFGVVLWSWNPTDPMN